MPALHTPAAGVVAMVSALVLLAGCAGREPVPAQLPPAEQPPARAWTAEQLSDLRAATQVAAAHGLPTESEALALIDRLEPLSLRDGDMARRLDAAADALFARLASNFAIGAVDPVQTDPDWRIARPPPPDAIALRRAVMEGGDVSDTLSALLPNAPDYAILAAELARVQAEPDGAVDAGGLSKQARVDRLRASLERWRWLPRGMPPRRIDVLVPLFELRMRDGETSTRHAVIVGARRTQSPSFAAAIETITLNPTWTPPSSIVHGELLPRFRRNPNAAAAEDFDVIDDSGRIIDPADVDWRARPFPYTLRQRAGPGNALGRLRFDLPNPYAVFLHDTPSRGLFERDDRALSHGCIRVSEPVRLAANVLGDPMWDEPALDTAIEGGATQVITLGVPLPIYVLYLTAAPEQEGAVRYGEDIYDRDRALLRALDRASPMQIASRAATQTECSSTR
ncbi:MAG: L,D-transpeptidase family protein [Hyphomonadaceae bacterium]|nr:L,D-transpeptidase family protein [Hyphomonadaceae bacterium]